jgi:hypothetical protein
MRYASGETDSEKKMMYCFKKGLNSHLKVALLGHAYRTHHLEVDALHKEKKRWFKSSSCGPARRGHVLTCLLRPTLATARRL